jgi:hypothetical protein
MVAADMVAADVDGDLFDTVRRITMMATLWRI